LPSDLSGNENGHVKQFSKQQTTGNRQQMNIYEEWLKAKAVLKQAQKTELSLRNKICRELLADKMQGTAKHNDRNVTFVAKAVLNYSLDEQALIAKESQLTDEERACIRTKYAVNVSAYKQLAGKPTLGRLVTIKPGQAQLTAKVEDVIL